MRSSLSNIFELLSKEAKASSVPDQVATLGELLALLSKVTSTAHKAPVRIIEVLRKGDQHSRDVYISGRLLGLPFIGSLDAKKIATKAKELFLNYNIAQHLTDNSKKMFHKPRVTIAEMIPKDEHDAIFEELEFNTAFSYKDISDILDSDWSDPKTLSFPAPGKNDSKKSTVVNVAFDLGAAHPSEFGLLGFAARASFKAVLPELFKAAVCEDLCAEMGLTLNNQQRSNLFATTLDSDRSNPLKILDSRAVKNILAIHDHCEREGLTLINKQALVDRYFRTSNIHQVLQELSDTPLSKSSESTTRQIALPSDIAKVSSRMDIFLEEVIPSGHPLRKSNDWEKASRWLTNVSQSNFDLIKRVLDENPEITQLRGFVNRVRDLRKLSEIRAAITPENEARNDSPQTTSPVITEQELVLASNVNGRSPFSLWYNQDIVNTVSQAAVDRLLIRLRTGGGSRKALSTSPRTFELKNDYLGGIRIYYGLDKDKIVLLNGGNKSDHHQSQDIEVAVETMKHYLATQKT